MTQKITTAVFPVAGMGTRFLPVTKAGPKEMLPIVDKPLIQYVVEEAISAGITELVFVTSGSKRAIEDYFDSNYELESRLEERGKYDVLSTVKNILPPNVKLVYVRQTHPRGLGDAVLCAKHVVRDRPFAVLLADDIIDGGERSCMQDMVEAFDQTQSSILAVEQIPNKDTDRYGIVSLEADGSSGGHAKSSSPEVEGHAESSPLEEARSHAKSSPPEEARSHAKSSPLPLRERARVRGNNKQQPHFIKAIVEKPKPEVAPSNLAVTGRYILTPRIFDLLEKTEKGVGGEIQLTDAISELLKEERITAFPFNGRRYDCGSRMGFLEATIDYALKRPELADRLRRYLGGVVEAF